MATDLEKRAAMLPIIAYKLIAQMSAVIHSIAHSMCTQVCCSKPDILTKALGLCAATFCKLLCSDEAVLLTVLAVLTKAKDETTQLLAFVEHSPMVLQAWLACEDSSMAQMTETNSRAAAASLIAAVQLLIADGDLGGVAVAAASAAAAGVLVFNGADGAVAAAASSAAAGIVKAATLAVVWHASCFKSRAGAYRETVAQFGLTAASEGLTSTGQVSSIDRIV